jgi:hypothetical protein
MGLYIIAQEIVEVQKKNNNARVLFMVQTFRKTNCVGCCVKKGGIG